MDSLRIRLPLVIGALVVAAVATSWWAAHREFERELVAAGGERATTAAMQVAELLERAVQQSVNTLGPAANHIAIVRYLRDPGAATQPAALERLKALAPSGPRRVELWSADGNRLLEVSLASSGGDDAASLPPAPRPAAVGVGPLRVAGSVAYTDLVTSVDIQSGSSAPERLGFLVLRSTLAANPPGIFSRLMGRDAVLRIGSSGGQWTDLTGAVPAPLVDLAPGAATAEYQAADGTTRLGAAVPVRGTPWVVWVEFPKSLITEPAARFVRRMSLLGPVFVVIGALIAAIISVRITNPLRQLADAADAIRGGDLSRRVAITRSDEIGRLGQAFNAMVEMRLKALATEDENRRVLEANRLKSEFVANMSHELRTPLNVIMGFAELMHLGKVGPVSTQHREYLADILASAKHLLRLINDVLDLAKVESGTMELHPEPVDLRQLVSEIRDVLRELAANKKLRVDTDVHPDVTTVIVDQARLKQVLYNYVSNAIKFTGDGGRVMIAVRPAGEAWFRIDVEDTGIGIAPEDLGRLFVEFQQLESGAGKRHQGTGLGLALSKRFAEALGGHVEVKSTVGAGSTFSVILPRAARTS